MFPQKRKRKPQSAYRSWIRLVLIMLIVAPASFVALHPRFGQSLFADGIALSIGICAAVYLVHTGILWGIAQYLGIDDTQTQADDSVA